MLYTRNLYNIVNQLYLNFKRALYVQMVNVLKCYTLF